MGEIITRTNTEIINYFKNLEKLSTLVDVMCTTYIPTLNGERYLTDTELAEKLRLSKRTLSEYRSSGKIPYYQVGGKILYKESDIVKLLDKNRREAFL